MCLHHVLYKYSKSLWISAPTGTMGSEDKGATLLATFVLPCLHHPSYPTCSVVLPDAGSGEAKLQGAA